MTAAAETLPSHGFVSRSAFQLFWSRFREDKVALLAAVVIALLIFIAIGGGPLAQAITGHPSNGQYQLYMTGPRAGQPYMENEFGAP
jgi:ABC-type antimicrobial peptide transport system permease subunit